MQTPSLLEKAVELTQLLLSIRCVQEAKAVSACPVAILDVKEPKRGSLGAPNRKTLTQISRAVGSQQVKSFALGELSNWLLSPIDATSLVNHYGECLGRFQFVKIGLAGVVAREGWQQAWVELFRALPNGTQPVMVCYFDHDRCRCPSPKALIEFAAKQPNCSTVLFDTFEKSQNLFGHVSKPELAELVALVRHRKMQSVVAGSIDISVLPTVVETRPDFVGVRGAVCQGDRTASIQVGLVNEFASCLQPSNTDLNR